MKLTDKVAVLPTSEARAKRRATQQDAKAQIARARVERRLALEREQARLYERLCEADKGLALATRLPPTREERVALARSLRVTSSGRKRSAPEIAAIVGVSVGTIRAWFYDPDGSRAARANRHVAPRKAPVKKVQAYHGEPVMENAAEHVRRIRKLLGLSQHALAVKLGVQPDTVTSWETGRRRPSLSTYQAVLNLLREG